MSKVYLISSAHGQMTSMSGSGPPATRSPSGSPGAAGQEGEVYFDVRWPDGRRLDSRKQVTQEGGRQLVEGGICDEVRSPSGILRYFRMRRNPPLSKFGSILAEDSLTTAGRKSTTRHRFPAQRHPWEDAPVAGDKQQTSS